MGYLDTASSVCRVVAPLLAGQRFLEMEFHYQKHSTQYFELSMRVSPTVFFFSDVLILVQKAYKRRSMLLAYSTLIF